MNLTIAVDPSVLKRARVRAIEEDTSVNAVLREHLVAYAERRASLRGAAEDAARGRADAVERLVRLSRVPRPAAAPPRTTRDEFGNRNWKRDDLYDR